MTRLLWCTLREEIWSVVCQHDWKLACFSQTLDNQFIKHFTCSTIHAGSSLYSSSYYSWDSRAIKTSNRNRHTAVPPWTMESRQSHIKITMRRISLWVQIETSHLVEKGRMSMELFHRWYYSTGRCSSIIRSISLWYVWRPDMVLEWYPGRTFYTRQANTQKSVSSSKYWRRRLHMELMPWHYPMVAFLTACYPKTRSSLSLSTLDKHRLLLPTRAVLQTGNINCYLVPGTWYQVVPEV